ncbi:MAG: pentapeptide repeat-containing protein [Desulfobaccales bacterium]
MPTCNFNKPRRKDVYYPDLCQNPQLESDPEGMCILHSRQLDKDLNAFSASIMEKLERKDYNFRGVFFPGDMLLFARQVFHNANFEHAEFNSWTFFENSQFSGETNFSQVKFGVFVSFIKAKFCGRANFYLAKFNGNVDFSETEFDDQAIFTAAQFAGQATFATINFQSPKERDHPFIGNFRDLKIEHSTVVRFQDLSLANVAFAGTDLRHIEYRNITWHSYSNWFFRKDVKWLPIRQAVYDEVLLDEKEPSLFYRAKANLINIALFWRWPYLKISKPNKAEYARVEELYRYIRINYENEGDYKNAGDFHYGEMEMHRRASPWRRWIFFSWYNLYRSLSGYGERPLWALMWLVILLFGLSGLVWRLGLEVVNPLHIADFGDSFIYLLQKATLQRPTWAEPVTFMGKLIAGFSVLLIPGQTALFLLALRNRLGRRR